MMLSPEAKAKKAAYQREWRRKNPDKERAARERYWEKKVREQQEIPQEKK